MSHYVDEKPSSSYAPRAVRVRARWQPCRGKARLDSILLLLLPSLPTAAERPGPIVKLCGGFWHWGDHLRANGPTSAPLLLGQRRVSGSWVFPRGEPGAEASGFLRRRWPTRAMRLQLPSRVVAISGFPHLKRQRQPDGFVKPDGRAPSQVSGRILGP